MLAARAIASSSQPESLVHPGVRPQEEVHFPAGTGRKRLPVLSRTKVGATLDQVIWLNSATGVTAINQNCQTVPVVPVGSFPVNNDQIESPGTGTGAIVTGIGFWKVTTEADFWVDSTNNLFPVDEFGSVGGVAVEPDIAMAVANLAVFVGLSGINFANLHRVSLILQAGGLKFNGVIPYPEYDEYLASVAWEHGLKWGGAGFEFIGGLPTQVIHSGNTTNAIASLSVNPTKTYRSETFCGAQASGEKLVRTTTVAQAAAVDLIKELAWEVRCDGVAPGHETETTYYCGIRELLRPGEFSDFYVPEMELLLGYATFSNGISPDYISGLSVGDVVTSGGVDFTVLATTPLTIESGVDGVFRVLDNTVTGTLYPSGSYTVTAGRLTSSLPPGDSFLIAAAPIVLTRTGFNPQNVSSGEIAQLLIEVE